MDSDDTDTEDAFDPAVQRSPTTLHLVAQNSALEVESMLEDDHHPGPAVDAMGGSAGVGLSDEVPLGQEVCWWLVAQTRPEADILFQAVDPMLTTLIEGMLHKASDRMIKKLGHELQTKAGDELLGQFATKVIDALRDDMAEQQSSKTAAFKDSDSDHLPANEETTFGRKNGPRANPRRHSELEKIAAVSFTLAR